MSDKEKVVGTFEKIISICKEDGCDFVDLTFEDAEQILALLNKQEAAYQGAVELLRQKMILFDDAIKRLKKRETVIRCKDCKWWHESKTNKWHGDCGQANGITLKPSDWYCADGKRQESR